MLKPEYFEDGYDFHPVIKEIISRIHTEGPVDGSSLETLAFIKDLHPEMLNGDEATLLSTMGLFYKTGEPKNLFELVYSLFSASIEEVLGENILQYSRMLLCVLGKMLFSHSRHLRAQESLSCFSN